MGDPAEKIDVEAEAASARGDALVRQLRAMGLSDEEIFGEHPTDVTPDENAAWLEGRAPCPWPR